VTAILNPRGAKRGARGVGIAITKRDRRIKGSPAMGFIPSYHTRHGIVYQCAKCGARCDGPKMMCSEHLAIELRP